MKNYIIENSFNTFNPKDYLNEYYSKIGSENDNLLKFFANSYRNVDKNSLLLEFSGGPTIYSLISAADKVREIHFCDYLESNLNEIRLWKLAAKDAFDWSPFFKRALQIEGLQNPQKKDIKRRQELLKIKLKKIFQNDVFKAPTFREKDKYNIVSVNFVPESITSSKKEWENLVKNICLILKRNGTVIVSALKDATYYRVGGKFFPAVSITENDLKKVLGKLGFEIIDLYCVPAEVLDIKSPDYEGYQGFIFVKAKKNKNRA